MGSVEGVCPIVIGAENQDFSELALKLLYARTPRDLDLMVVVAWAIWHNRNLRVFESVNQEVGLVWNYAVSMLFDYKEASKFYLLGRSSCEVCWKNLPVKVYKINVDGATADDGRRSSIGVVIRDFRGNAVAALCRVLPSNFSVEETKALAMEAWILLAKEMDLHQIIVEFDSLSIVQSILSMDFKGEIGHIFHGILCFLDGFNNWQIRHLKRDYNRVAHALARFARCM